ncbi:MAG: inositol monophosphatase family protein [Bacteroidota bacterium]
MNLENICEKTRELTYEVGRFIKNEVNKLSSDSIKTKDTHDFVTYVDKTSEERLVMELQKILPGANFITEENTIPPDPECSVCVASGSPSPTSPPAGGRETLLRGKQDPPLEGSSMKKSGNENENYTWIIDPLDGTTNFIHSVPCYSISIALMKDNEIVMGVVYEINLKECFYSWKGSKAYLNGKEINVSNVKKLDDSLLVTGFSHSDFTLLDECMDLFKYFMKHTHGVRRFGSAAVDLVYVACGRFDGFYEYSLHAWDVAAGAFIVQQAGGKVCDFRGKDDFIFGKEIISSGPGIFDEFSEVVRRYLGA